MKNSERGGTNGKQTTNTQPMKNLSDEKSVDKDKLKGENRKALEMLPGRMRKQALCVSRVFSFAYRFILMLLLQNNSHLSVRALGTGFDCALPVLFYCTAACSLFADGNSDFLVAR